MKSRKSILSPLGFSSKKIYSYFSIFLVSLLFSNAYSQWTTVSNLSGTTLTSIKFFNENLGFAGSGSGVWKTFNSGINWTLVFSGGPVNSICFPDSLNGFASGSPGRIYKTTDGGLTWSTYILTVGMTGVNSISFFNANTGLSVGYNGIIQRTTNSGLNWVLHDSVYFSERNCVSTHSSGFGLYVGGSIYDNAEYSTNFGGSWHPTYFSTLGRLLGAYVVNANLGFVCGNNGRIKRTTDQGVSWTTQDSLTSRALKCIYFPDVNNGTIVGDNGTILHTTNSGVNWSIQNSGTTTSLTGVCFINQQTGWAVSYEGVVLKTTNGGLTFINAISSEIPDKFSLSQNYPNPFNPNTLIKFTIAPPLNLPLTGGDVTALAGAVGVKLIIYDVLGREVAMLVSQQMQPGSYSVDWDGTNYPSGVYFYKLSIGNEQLATRKMVLIK